MERESGSAAEELERLLAGLPPADAERARTLIQARIDLATSEAERRLQVAQEAGSIGTYEICLATQRCRGTPRFFEIFGLNFSDGVFTSEQWHRVIHPDDLARVLDDAHQNVIRAQDRRSEYRIVVDGAVRWVSSRGKVFRDANGRPVRAYGAVQDVTERKTQELALWRAANEDSLTGLSNRKHFRERLEVMIAASDRVGLIALDLDRLKEANDAHGHAAGDELIRTAAQRLASVCPAEAIIGRLGGDEFAVAASWRDVAGLAAAGERIVGELQTPLSFRGALLDCGGTAGCALYPDHAGDAETLMQAADVALMLAKLTGRGRARLWRPRDDLELARLARKQATMTRLAA